MKWTYLFILFVAIASCTSKPAAQQAEEEPAPTQFGEDFKITETVSVSKAINMLETQDTIYNQVQGTVTSVCKVKGCWMNVVETEDGESMFVKFKDYGFFMPLDFEGTEVVMNGMAFTEITPVDELRHYAEDEGASEEEIAAITEPEMEYKYMASGVRVVEK